MIRGRAGRARHITNPRATVRTPREDPVKDRRITDSAGLRRACEVRGATITTTADGHLKITGPAGFAIVSPKWGDPRDRQNAIADVRRHAGIDVSAPATRPGVCDRPAPPPKLVTSGGRPTLAYEHPENLMTTSTNGHAPSMPTRSPEGSPAGPSREDYDYLLELVEALTGRVDTLTEQVAALEQQRTGPGPSRDERLQQVRDRILGWFRTLPPGMQVPAGVVTSNLCDGEKETNLYRRQVVRLAQQGRLTPHGGNPGRLGGAHTLYSLPTETAQP